MPLLRPTRMGRASCFGTSDVMANNPSRLSAEDSVGDNTGTRIIGRLRRRQQLISTDLTVDWFDRTGEIRTRNTAMFKVVSLPLGKLAYEESGSATGTPIVFIHGNSCDRQVFAGQLACPRLQPFRLIAVDLPGHGDSSIGQVDATATYVTYSIPYYVQAINAFVEALCLEAPLVVGHSLGGHIAIALAQRINLLGLLVTQTPPIERVDDLASAFRAIPALHYLLSATPSDEQLEELVRAFTYAQPLPAWLFASLRRTIPACRQNLAASLVTHPPLNEVSIIRSLTCPVTIGISPHDRLVNEGYLSGLTFGEKQDLRQVLFRRSGHFPQLEEPESFNQAILDLAQRTGQTVSTTLA